MNRLIIILMVAVGALLFNSSQAQEGYIYRIAGCHGGNLNFTDGVPATNYYVAGEGITVDGQGNVYLSVGIGDRVRKIVQATGLIYTIAGNGNQGFSGDGGPAIAASMKNPAGICLDMAGNLYIADAGNNRIRRVDAITGNIATVAGGGASLSDGIAAITTSISPTCVYVDGAGNIYTGSNNKVRKIDGVTGIITTIAGNGINMEAGDGGQALNASFMGTINCITEDGLGDIYVVSDAGRVRKIDAVSGIINTVAGGGNSTADGVPATTANLTSLSSCGLDAAGNIFLADNYHSKIRKVDVLTGLITTICGNGNTDANNVPAISAKTDSRMMYVNEGGTIYFSSDSFVYKIIGAPYYPSDSFSVSTISTCSGTTLSVLTNTYVAGRHIKAFWGDSQVPDDSAVHSGNYGGYAIMNHYYAATGIYTIKLVLYDGNMKIDSMHLTYNRAFCNTIGTDFYLDMNGNCTKDSFDIAIPHPMLIEVDSNNVAVDTISAMSGFYYSAYGSPGDVYKFKIIVAPAGTQVSCPANGIITATLQNSIITPVNEMGFSCITGNNFDLAAEAVVPVTGIHDQWGNIYIRNSYCAPANATVTVNFSPKYVYHNGDARPAPASTTATSITWNLTSLSESDPHPAQLYYVVWANPLTGNLTINDTVQEHITVTPTAGDQDASNNAMVIFDTVKGSCDPNLIEVTPKGNILAGTQLKYKIEFENVGNDTAFSIYVLDTLPNELDASSLRLVSSTHAIYVSPYGDGVHNIVKFDFPNINLLDSSHHNACTGTFTYTINSKAGLPFGTHIDHKAGIYFDDNGLVETNMVENIIGFPASVNNVSAASKVQVFPNPASSELTIKADNGLYSSFTISNSIGQEVMGQALNSGETRVNVKSLPAGVYYITLKGGDGNVVRKFVKM